MIALLLSFKQDLSNHFPDFHWSYVQFLNFNMACIKALNQCLNSIELDFIEILPYSHMFPISHKPPKKPIVRPSVEWNCNLV